MTTKPGLTGPPSDLERHQQPRLRDLIGEGAGGRESLLLLVGRRREGAEKGFYGPPRRERNGYGQAFRIRRLGAPEGVVGILHRCFKSFARDGSGRPQFSERLVELQHLRGERVEFGFLRCGFAPLSALPIFSWAEPARPSAVISRRERRRPADAGGTAAGGGFQSGLRK